MNIVFQLRIHERNLQINMYMYISPPFNIEFQRNYIYIYIQLLKMHVQHGRGVIYHIFFVSRRLNFSVRNSYSLMASFVNLAVKRLWSLSLSCYHKSDVMTHGFCPKLITGGWYLFHFFIPLLLCKTFFNVSGEFPRCWWIQIMKCI